MLYSLLQKVFTPRERARTKMPMPVGVTLLSFLLASITSVFSVSACAKIPPAVPYQPALSLSQGRIYAQYDDQYAGFSLAVFRADTGAFLWRAASVSPRVAPVADNTTTLVQISTDLVALNAQNGTQRWSTSGMVPEALLNGIVYATGYESLSEKHGPALWLSALREGDGSQLWTTVHFSGSSQVVQLAAEQGQVFLLTDAGFFVLQADDGQLLWSSSGIGFGSSFTIANDIVYLSRGSNQGLDAREVSHGHLLWTFRATDISPHPPVLTSDGVLCVETGVDVLGATGELYGLRAKDGVRLWSHTGDFLDGTMATAQGILYVSSADKGLVAVQAQNGTERWQFDGSGIPGSNASSLIDLDENSGVIYTAQSSSIVEVGTNGSFLRKIPLSSTEQSSYQEVGGVIYQLIPGGKVENAQQQYWTRMDLTATSGRNGKLLWSTHIQF
jgi:outer membrane protein assembly factor BamB